MATLGSAPSESTVGDGLQQPDLLRSMHDHIDNVFPMTKRSRPSYRCCCGSFNAAHPPSGPRSLSHLSTLPRTDHTPECSMSRPFPPASFRFSLLHILHVATSRGHSPKCPCLRCALAVLLSTSPRLLLRTILRTRGTVLSTVISRGPCVRRQQGQQKRRTGPS